MREINEMNLDIPFEVRAYGGLDGGASLAAAFHEHSKITFRACLKLIEVDEEQIFWKEIGILTRSVLEHRVLLDWILKDREPRTAAFFEGIGNDWEKGVHEKYCWEGLRKIPILKKIEEAGSGQGYLSLFEDKEDKISAIKVHLEKSDYHYLSKFVHPSPSMASITMNNGCFGPDELELYVNTAETLWVSDPECHSVFLLDITEILVRNYLKIASVFVDECLFDEDIQSQLNLLRDRM